jgi:predicted PurR-regulated permease PerM
MEDMTGRWAWRGSRRSEADDPAPAALTGTAEAEESQDRPAGAADLDGVATDRPDGTGERQAGAGQRRDRAGEFRDGPGETANGTAGDRRAPADQPLPRESREPQVPAFLQRAAAWSWRLIVVGLLLYVAFRVASALRLVVLPCFAALLLTALLQPLTARLRRIGMPSLAATWCTVLAAIVVLAGIGVLAANRVSADYPRLQGEVKHTAHQVQASLAGPPFHLSSARLQQYYNNLTHFLSQHQSLIAGTVLTGGRIVLELLTGLVLMLFITFFLLKDGDRIWAWLINGLPAEGRRRARKAGPAAWSALVNYVRGTTAVAAIHAVVIGLTLFIMGVPLLVPLVIVVFLAAYVPLVGILVAGALAILVTLGTKGWLAAVILLAVFVGENQVESHLLQPLVVGRIVRLHPLAIILVLAVGGIVAGIAGAIVAVPTAASLTYAWPHLRPGRPERADREGGREGTQPSAGERDAQ